MMRNRSLRLIVLFGLSSTLLLQGCGPATPEPTPSPTVDPQPTYQAIAAQAVETAFAALTQNAPTATPPTPSETPFPTETPGPTDTPAPTATETRVFIPWTHTPTATLPAYGCAVMSVSPAKDVELKVDQEFDAVWSLKNIGVNPWLGSDVDARFIDGTHLHTGGDLVDISGTVAPNGTYTLTIDMKAPSSDGTYTTEWSLWQSQGYICEFALTINVVK